MYYFVDSNGQQHGPVAADDLPRYGVTPQTLVWRQGMSDWQPASSLSELSGVFAAPPPAAPPALTQPPPTPQTVFCKSCRNPIIKGAKFCKACGAAVAANASLTKNQPVCKKCGAHMKEGAQFCKTCGMSLVIQKPAVKPKKKGEGGSLIHALIFICGFVVLLVLFFVYFALVGF